MLLALREEVGNSLMFLRPPMRMGLSQECAALSDALTQGPPQGVVSNATSHVLRNWGASGERCKILTMPLT